MRDSRRVLIIVNPTARSGRVAALMDGVESEFSRAFEHVLMCPTEGRGHARRLAAHARDFDLVVAAGGDGTVHEAALGLADHDLKTPLAVLPLGSGNDFARMLGMRKRVRDAVQQIRNAEAVAVDTGCVSWTSVTEESSRGFVNAVGFGLDAMTAHLAPKYKSWPFGLGYTVSALDALWHWVSAGVTIWDTSEGRSPVFSGRLMFATIGNARDSGGGYRLTPKARIADGALDLCAVEHLSRWRAIRTMPRARTGSHLSMPEVTYRVASSFRIESDRGLPVHTDGEVCTLEARTIEVYLRAGSLNVVVPEEGLGSL